MSYYNCTIVIPLYKTDLKNFEIRSLQQCISVFKDFNIAFFIPEGLNIETIITKYKPQKYSIEYFDSQYFTSVMGYNSLMLSSKFYERFLDYKYLLIYQLDAFVFKNELTLWCDKGYDYIGAPWIASPNTLIKRVLSIFDSKQKKERQKIFFKVGNGGFSLRNIEKCFTICNEMKPEISKNLKRNKDDFYIMEDVFWSITVPKHYPDFKTPNYKEAVAFAIDRKPKLAMQLNNNELPFGCHGTDKRKVNEFWEEILESNFIG